MGDESFSLVLLRLSEPTPHSRHSLWLFLPKYSRRGSRAVSSKQLCCQRVRLKVRSMRPVLFAVWTKGLLGASDPAEGVE